MVLRANRNHSFKHLLRLDDIPQLGPQLCVQAALSKARTGPGGAATKAEDEAPNQYRVGRIVEYGTSLRLFHRQGLFTRVSVQPCWAKNSFGSTRWTRLPFLTSSSATFSLAEE